VASKRLSADSGCKLITVRLPISRRKPISIWQFRSSSRATILIASIESDLNDKDLAKLHGKVTEAVGRLKSLGVFIDAATFYVLDS
jgi:hypothetical protein